ncbi:polyketide cyclase [bacterium]|nr:polyketide cyclase [bacterium]
MLKAPVERVFRAFTNADAQAAWLPPYGFVCQVHQFDPVVGGRFRMSFINFTNQSGHTFGGEFLEILPGKLIKYTDEFEDANLPGTIVVTVQFKEVMCGTEIEIAQENVPSVIPPEMCYMGWQESLIKLAHLVEPEINQ